MPRGISRCPGCGQPVTPFAAGCAVCGADLEAARARAAARRRIALPRPRWLADSGLDWTQIAIGILLALFASPIGAVLAAYWAQQRSRSGDAVMMWVMLGVAALALAALLAPVWFWSHLYRGL